MVMSAEHRSTFAALHRQWRRPYISEKFSSGTKNPKQINELTYLSFNIRNIDVGNIWVYIIKLTRWKPKVKTEKKVNLNSNDWVVPVNSHFIGKIMFSNIIFRVWYIWIYHISHKYYIQSLQNIFKVFTQYVYQSLYVNHI